MDPSSTLPGRYIPANFKSLVSNAAPADQAIVTACSYLFRSLGSATGVALSATAFNQSLRTHLHSALGDSPDADRIADGVRQSLDFFHSLSPELRAIVAQCYSYGTRAAFVVQAVLVAGAAISAWFIREKRLS